VAIGFLIGFGAGCAGTKTTPDSDPIPAVQALLGSAREAADEGRLDDAAVDLEHALRLQPQSAVLWHELALVRAAQGQLDQAEAVALRSNSLAGDDRALQSSNWRLIAEARRARGDEEGALEAEARSR
jgi:predicted Zn-dependent protease